MRIGCRRVGQNLIGAFQWPPSIPKPRCWPAAAAAAQWTRCRRFLQTRQEISVLAAAGRFVSFKRSIKPFTIHHIARRRRGEQSGEQVRCLTYRATARHLPSALPQRPLGSMGNGGSRGDAVEKSRHLVFSHNNLSQSGVWPSATANSDDGFKNDCLASVE